MQVKEFISKHRAQVIAGTTAVVALIVLIVLAVSFLSELSNPLNHLKSDHIVLEYGTEISGDMAAYIDAKYMPEDISSGEFSVTIEDVNAKRIPAGTYTLILAYADNKTEISLTVEDSVAPRFTEFTDDLRICEGSKIDLTHFFKAEDIVGTETEEANVTIKDTLFDPDTPGIYNLTAVAEDVNGRTSERSLTVSVLSVEEAYEQGVSSYPDGSVIPCDKLDVYKAKLETEAMQDTSEDMHESLEADIVSTDSEQKDINNPSDTSDMIPDLPAETLPSGGEGASSPGSTITVTRRGGYTVPDSVDGTGLSGSEYSVASEIFSVIVSGQTTELQYVTDSVSDFDSVARIENALKNTFGLDTAIFSSKAKVNANGQVDGSHPENNTYIALTIPKPASIIERAETLYSKETTPANEAVLAAGLYTGMNEADAVRTIADYIVNHTTYSSNGGNADAGFATGTGSCHTYAEMFQQMCADVGIQCEYITGYTSGGLHAWNRVLIGGSWYWIDTCWMDSGTGNVYYLSKDLWSDHILK